MESSSHRGGRSLWIARQGKLSLCYTWLRFISCRWDNVTNKFNGRISSDQRFFINFLLRSCCHQRASTMCLVYSLVYRFYVQRKLHFQQNCVGYTVRGTGAAPSFKTIIKYRWIDAHVHVHQVFICTSFWTTNNVNGVRQVDRRPYISRLINIVMNICYARISPAVVLRKQTPVRQSDRWTEW